MSIPEDNQKELEISHAHAVNSGDDSVANAIGNYLQACEWSYMQPNLSPDEFEGSPMERIAVHQQIADTRKELQVKRVYVDRDAMHNRDDRLEGIDTKLIALKAYDTIALAIVDIKRLIKNITDTL